MGRAIGANAEAPATRARARMILENCCVRKEKRWGFRRESRKRRGGKRKEE
jgi:hypothetical protein